MHISYQSIPPNDFLIYLASNNTSFPISDERENADSEQWEQRLNNFQDLLQYIGTPHDYLRYTHRKTKQRRESLGNDHLCLGSGWEIGKNSCQLFAASLLA
jgi:hypothetical protein